jgi:lipoate-protein ligase A
MAVDEAVLESTAAGKSPPTLRLYAWSPACLSLGLAQPASDVDLATLDALGWTCVRRPTGGRAILHTDELTYAVIASAHEPVVAGGVLESYKRLAKALLNALDHLTLSARADQTYQIPAGSSPNGPVCFEVPSNYEITVAGKKLVGSAQARRKEGFLQHGTLPLFGDLRRITSVLAFPSPTARAEAASRVLEHATTVEHVLGKKITWKEAADAWANGFSETFQVMLEPSDLSPEEEARAADLLQQKYAQWDWTQRTR